MDNLGPHSSVTTTVLMKGTQLGATEFLLCVLGYYLHLVPSAILCVQPSVEMARRFSNQRVQEMVDLTAPLKSLVAPARSGTLPAAVLYKATRSGGTLVLTGANSASSLRSLPARIVLLDECDAYGPDIDHEGDPADLAIQRAESFGSGKRILIVSTPTVRGLSRMERLFAGTDQRVYRVPCPYCAMPITLEFERLRIEAGRAMYSCPLCASDIEERDKPAMLAAGHWEPMAACAPDTRGYHLNQLYSPWTRWADLLRRWDAAKGVPEREKTFVNTALARTWGPPTAEVPEIAELMARAEPWAEGTIPEGGCFLTAGADVQADRIEVEIVAWGRSFESWSIGYFVLYGSPAEPEVWMRLDELLSKSWPHVSGLPLQIQAACVDCGYSAADVTAFTRSRHGRRIFATKGLSNAFSKPIWPRRATFDRNRHAIYLVSSDEAKLFLANRLRIDKRGPGYVHTPLARERGWYEQLLSERLVIVKGKRQWMNSTRARNEALDCRCLAICALHSRMLAGVDLNHWCEEFDELLAPATPRVPPRVNGPAVYRSKFVNG
jgi:phage terminase large subunit GpA-like protein